MYCHLSHSDTRGSDQPPKPTSETVERNIRAQDDAVVPAPALSGVHVAQGSPPPAASPAPVPTREDVAPDGAVTCPLRITTPCPPVLAPPAACAQDEQLSIPCARSAHMPPTDKEGSVVEMPPAPHFVLPAVEMIIPPGRRIGPVEMPGLRVPDEDDAVSAGRRQTAHRSDRCSRACDAPAFPCSDCTTPRPQRDAQPPLRWKTSDERLLRSERDEGRADGSPIYPRTVTSNVCTAPTADSDASHTQGSLAVPSLWEPTSPWSDRATSELAVDASRAPSSPFVHSLCLSPPPIVSAPPASPASPLLPPTRTHRFVTGSVTCRCAICAACVAETEGEQHCSEESRFLSDLEGEQHYVPVSAVEGALDSALDAARRGRCVAHEGNTCSIPHLLDADANLSSDYWCAPTLPEVLVWSVHGVSLGPDAADALRGAQAIRWSSSVPPVTPGHPVAGAFATGGQGGRRTKLKIPMPSYDGTPDLDMFEAFAFKWNSWARSRDLTEEESVEYMAHALEGKAARWFMRYVAGRQHDWTLNRAYTQLFNNCFPPMFRERLRRKLLSLKQDGRPVRDFAQDIENLSLRFADIGEYSIKMIFWDGVDNYIREFWREKGRSMEYDSFDTLVEYAYRVESREEERRREESLNSEEEQNSDSDTHSSVTRASQDADPDAVTEEPQISRIAVDGESGDQEEYDSEGEDHSHDEEGSDGQLGAEEEPFNDDYDEQSISEGSQADGEVYYDDEVSEYEDEEQLNHEESRSGEEYSEEEDDGAEAHELDSSQYIDDAIPTHYRRRILHH